MRSEKTDVIAIDTSSMIAYLEGDIDRDTAAVAIVLEEGTAVLPAPVLTELFSDPKLDPKLASTLSQVPILTIDADFWRRAGLLRARLLSSRRKARLADTLIAQNCLDHKVPLITRDRDFASFAAVTKLTLLP